MPLTSEDKEFIILTIEPLKRDIISCNEQLKKINGRVNKHDELITEALVERSGNRQHQSTVAEEVKCLDVRLSKTEEELMEYRFFKKYPKSILYLTAGFIFLVLYEIIEKFIV